MQALEFSRVDHFQNVDIQRLIGNDAFESPILIFERFYLRNVANFEPAELRFPAVKHCRADAVLSANLVRRYASFMFFKKADDLDFAESGFFHGDSSRPLASEFSTYFRALFQATRHNRRTILCGRCWAYSDRNSP